jgi:hypothetical protein
VISEVRALESARGRLRAHGARIVRRKSPPHVVARAEDDERELLAISQREGRFCLPIAIARDHDVVADVARRDERQDAIEVAVSTAHRDRVLAERDRRDGVRVEGVGADRRVIRFDVERLRLHAQRAAGAATELDAEATG